MLVRMGPSVTSESLFLVATGRALPIACVKGFVLAFEAGELNGKLLLSAGMTS